MNKKENLQEIVNYWMEKAMDSLASSEEAEVSKALRSESGFSSASY